MKYTVRSTAGKYRLEIERGVDFSSGANIELAKENYHVRVLEKTEIGDVRAVSINNRVYSIQVRRRPNGLPYKVIINGDAYPVEIEKVESTRFKPPAPERKVDGMIRANLPGQISRIVVEEGERVKCGQVIAVLEAMKMENEIMAPKSGKIVAVCTSQGASVNTGDALVSIG